MNNNQTPNKKIPGYKHYSICDIVGSGPFSKLRELRNHLREKEFKYGKNKRHVHGHPRKRDEHEPKQNDSSGAIPAIS